MNQSSCRKNLSVRDSRVSQKQTTIPQITLSQCQKIYPQFFNEQKIALVQKGVTKIDKVTPKFQRIDTLYLSNNNLSDLENLEQFPQLMHLTLSNNNLCDLNNVVLKLQKLPHLQTLTLHGNALCKSLFYRVNITSKLSNLMVFDGKNINEAEVKSAKLSLMKMENIMQLLLQNYSDLVKQNNYSKKLSTKIELMKQLRTEKALIEMDDDDDLDDHPEFEEQELKQIRESLLEDINTISCQIKLSNLLNEEQLFDQASSMLIIKQQGILAEINQTISEKIQTIQKMNPKQNNKDQQPQLMVQKQMRGRQSALNNSQRSKKLQFSENEEQQQFSKLRKSLVSERQRTPKQQSGNKSNRHMFNSCSSEKKTKSVYDVSPSKEDPQPQKLNFQPQKFEEIKSKKILKPQDTSTNYIKELLGQVDVQSLYIDELEKLNLQQQTQLSDYLKQSKEKDLSQLNINQENEFNKGQLLLKIEQLKNMNHLLDEKEKETCLILANAASENQNNQSMKLIEEEMQYQSSLKNEQIQQLKKTQFELQQQISLLKDQILDYENIRQDRQEQYHSQSGLDNLWKQETEKKLEASIKIATEFRLKIEQNHQIVNQQLYTEIEDLNRSKSLQEETIRNQEDKIDECFTIIRECQSVYESKLHESEKQNLVKDNVIFEQKQHLEQQNRTIDNLNFQLNALQSDMSKVQSLQNPILSIRNKKQKNQDSHGKTSYNQLMQSDREYQTPINSVSKLSTKYIDSSLKQSRLVNSRDNLQNKFVNLQSQLTNILSSDHSAAQTYNFSSNNAQNLIDSDLIQKKKKPFQFQTINHQSETSVISQQKKKFYIDYGKRQYQDDNEGTLFVSQDITNTRKNSPLRESNSHNDQYQNDLYFPMKSRNQIQNREILDEKIRNLQTSIGYELEKSRTLRL